MSDTPETDAVAEKINFGVDIDFARKLERERDEAREAFVIATDQMVVAQGKVREANKERDEALIDRTNGDIATMTINHYERILRERDEVKEKYRWAVIHWQIGSAKMERERDESAAMCGRYKQERDIAEADATNFRAKIFELINERDILRLDAQREAEQHDRMVGELEKVYAERDEARELLASEKITRDHIIKRGVQMQKERDEAIAARKASAADWLLQVENADRRVSEAKKMAARVVQDAATLADKLSGLELRSTEELARLEQERNEWKNKAYSHATDYTLMEAKCFRLEQELKEIHSNQSVIIKHYDKLKS